ncbi:DEAD/DEAH box helicase [Candidatus Woesearchaeota archaeon]|nr:DEAD/DEAH box helicase [Candidatus Woesearchaeota archaeon]
MEAFRKLEIHDFLLKVIKEEQFEIPSEIQERTIPLILAGKDVIAESATGSGKTLAFAAGILQNTERGKGIQALILTPTRELAEQIEKTFRKFSKYKPLEITAIYGGVSINPQIYDLRKSDIVVGTPGRMLDHLERRTIHLTEVKTLVLDEADRMLDMGFIEDVGKILKQCPVKRQTLLFSATISREITTLAHRYMKNPVRVSVASPVDPKKLTQIYYEVQNSLKFSLLVHFIKNERSGLVMVFCNTQHATDFVAKNLRFLGINALAIHGGFSQAKRNRAMEQFHAKRINVLVCTDVASRGLDIKGVSHIYNYDVPKESKQYIHRIGRTARAGKEGIAITLLSERDHDNFRRVLDENNIKVKKEKTPYVERINVPWTGKQRRFAQPNRGGWREQRRHFPKRSYS